MYCQTMIKKAQCKNDFVQILIPFETKLKLWWTGDQYGFPSSWRIELSSFFLFQCHVANMRYQCWFMLSYSQRSYGKFWCYSDFDQSTKLGTLTPYDVLSNFRRGDTWIPLGIPRFCKAARKIKTHYKCHIKCSIYKKYFYLWFITE